MRSDFLGVPFVSVIRIFKLVQSRIDVQIKLDLSLFKGVKLLHIGVYDKLRRADLLKGGVRTQKGMRGILSITDARADKKTEKQSTQVQKTAALLIRIVIQRVKTETQNKKSRAKIPVIRSRRSLFTVKGCLAFSVTDVIKIGFFSPCGSSVVKVIRRRGEIAVAVQPYGEGILCSAGIHLEAPGACGFGTGWLRHRR